MPDRPSAGAYVSGELWRFHGDDFAAIGFLNPISQDESFHDTEIVSMEEPPLLVSKQYQQEGFHLWQESLNEQMRHVFPHDPPNIGLQVKLA